METDVPNPLNQLTLGIPRCSRTDQNKRRLLPNELRNHRAIDSVFEPVVAPDLVDRVRGIDGGLAVPLLSPRRAVGDFPPLDQ